jgi:hypothetical protein
LIQSKFHISFKSSTILIGALPTWPYSADWGDYPGGGLGLILLIIVILALMGRI